MERLSDNAIEIVNELHTERLAYESEYVPIIDALNRLAEYEDIGLEPEKVVFLKNVVDDVFSDKPEFIEHKEYIEREAAKERLRMWITNCVLDGDNDAADCYRDCIDLLDSIPAADVVPAVRCQDCVYAHPLKDSKYDYLCHYWNGHSCNQNQFCSQGKRKEKTK